ncbi:MAG: hypothetical protein ACP5JH_06405 [Bacteroidota bacterium]|jgi:hypothetical protein
MNNQQRGLLLFVMGLIAFALLAFDANGQSSAFRPGVYRCSSYNVSGGGGSCQNMPLLALYPDGTYQYSSTRGRWSVRNDSLFLSKSTLWGPGKILGSNTIRFEYDYRGWHHVVTWVCTDCASSEPTNAKSPEASESSSSNVYVGVSLVLEFTTAVGGVSSFTIVPAEYARNYTHNAPLPEGAVQGLAWEKSSTQLALATSHNNKLQSGKRYVVFLTWPRETIPVAILDLPPTRSDFSATLQATLDGELVLERIGK